MRLLPLLAFVVCITFSFLILAAAVPHVGCNEIEGVVIGARDQLPTAAISGDYSVSRIAASVTSNATATANSTSTSSPILPVSTTIASPNTSPVFDNGTVTPAPGALPIQPQVTPAFGVGGFILIVTGAILALIGIRNLRVQVFLSAAFLASLGVTVLIVYVMKPPVRDAIQGAYLVAIFFTGAAFGALSIVFKDLTEGLGCLLGGFCSSMWLLCLKPGGLLMETNAKSGFIGAISVAFYAFSFSHYTRPYGMIVSTGVAGGTAAALGIDCYTCAGLKEFWLYIWALNGDIFPLTTETYPITRNIRVELAVTVIVAILGVVSQLRLWKLIKERRHKEEEIRKEEEKRNEAEAEVFRILEENNMRERQEWEARYDSLEKKAIPEHGDDAQCAADKVDLEKGDSAEMRSILSSFQVSYRCSDCRRKECSEYSSSDAGVTGDTGVHQHGSSTDGTPDQSNAVPFWVLDWATAARLEGDGESDVTATAGSDAATVRSKRFSGKALWKRMSIQSSLRHARSQEALVHNDGDSTLSAQGAIHEISDGSSEYDNVSRQLHEVPVKAHPDSGIIESTTSPRKRDSDWGKDQVGGTDGDEGIVRRQSSPSQSKTSSKRRKEKARLDFHTVKSLPERTSKVVQSYRTNEWAKHLCDAEIPEPEAIAPMMEKSPGNPVEAEEVPAPVNVEELLQTRLNAEAPSAVDFRVSAGNMANDYKPRSVPGVNSPKMEDPQSCFPSSGAPSAGPKVVLSSSALTSSGFYNDMRNFSGLWLTPTSAEPLREDQEPRKPKWKGPPLLAVREDMLRSRVSSTCLGPDPWASRNSLRQSIAMDASTRVSPLTSIPDEGDDVPLSRRRVMLRQQRTQSRHTSMPSSTLRWSQSSALVPGNTQGVMAVWRGCIREDLKGKWKPLTKQDLLPGGTGIGHPTHSSFPFGQPRRNSPMNVSLERGDISDLHREAMRRMQAKANQSVGGRYPG